MLNFNKPILLLGFALVLTRSEAQTKIAKKDYKHFVERTAQKEKNDLDNALKMSKTKNWSTTFKVDAKTTAVLIGTRLGKYPKYYTPYNNTDAAATTGTSKLWPGTSYGFNLTGASSALQNTLGEWDGSGVRATHRELTGRIIQVDTPKDQSNADHSTHVAGTMIAKGVNPVVKGMAFQAPNLLCWDFYNDISEVATGAQQGLLLSNHSYGDIAGWAYDYVKNVWDFYGQPNQNEDYQFGYYDSQSSSLDSIAYFNPYYLNVRAAGNNRTSNGPPVGTDYYRLDSSGNLVDAGPRPAGISSNNGYDILPTAANAKNIITVGAVSPITTGYTGPNDVVITNFSSWGPSDDGRIKPDLVADGNGVYSCSAQNDSSYQYRSGTSMATPNITGSLLLLQEYYNNLNPGSFLRAATLKGLAIHTANEAGPNPGPDYVYGWGLLNTFKAATAIQSQNKLSHLIIETDKDTTFTVNSDSTGNLTATISWTDPAGFVDTVNYLNNRSKKLVNDLDLRITNNGTTYLPWTLDVNNPSNAAKTGDNITDNVEKIEVKNTTPNKKYTITITHKGSLVGTFQPYSLLVSGVAPSTLPITFGQFTGFIANNLTNLTWQTLTESNLDHFIVEQSQDGINFKQVGTVSAKGNSNIANTYRFNVASASTSQYYRVVAIDKDGKSAYTKLIKINSNNTNAPSFAIHPNPVKNSQLNYNLTNLPIGKYTANVVSISGKIVSIRSVEVSSNLEDKTITLPSSIAKGSYILSIDGESTHFAKQFIVE